MRLAVVLGIAAAVLVFLTLLLGVSNYYRLRGQVIANRRLVHEVTQQNVEARYAGCISGDELRSALYQQAVQSRRTTPLLLTLVPQLDTREVRALIARANARQLEAFAPRGSAGCARYALEAVPAAARSQYGVR